MLERNAFTMVELLMVILLIGVVSTVVGTQFIDFRQEAKIAVTKKRMSEIREALLGNPDLIEGGKFVKPGLIIDVGEVPETIDSLVTQGSYPDFDYYAKKGWRGPYVNPNIGEANSWKKDGWGTDFLYNKDIRTLSSCGPDKLCGEANAADDITLAF
jgi:prepilin-type N-terminal cleavage/methylation domain-containing protein